jgi:hypothetical protein
MTDELRFCKDCKWFRAGDYTPTCAHPTSVRHDGPDLVTGETPPPRPRTCVSARWGMGFADLCGQDGRHWAPSEVGFA